MTWLRRYTGLIVVVALLAANFCFTAHTVNAEQAAQRRAGAAVEHKICTTLGELAALKPPAGDPHANPSRGYDQKLHSTLAQLGPDLGCR